MAEITIRPATRADLARLTEIYNYYVVNTPITFDLEPLTVEAREPWFEEHSARGPHRVMVAVEDGMVIGYASTGRFRVKRAYDTTAESSIYCAPEATGRGIGTKLYAALFEAIAGENVHRIVAGYVPPNPGSEKLHAQFGFRPVGRFTEQGYKFGRYWDVVWLERPLKLEARLVEQIEPPHQATDDRSPATASNLRFSGHSRRSLEEDGPWCLANSTRPRRFTPHFGPRDCA